MVYSAEQILAECGKTVDDVDVYIPHQANKRIIDYAAGKLGIPPEKTVVNVDRYGNTSSGSIPLALTDARVEGRLHDGALILMTGMGAGPPGARRSSNGRTGGPHRARLRSASRPGGPADGDGAGHRGGVPGRSRGLPRRVRASGLDLERLCFETPLEELVETEVRSRARRHEPRHPRRDARAGPRGRRRRRALGREFAALSAAGVLGPAEAIGLVRERGLAMAEAARQRPARWRRSSASPTRRSRSSAGGSSACGRRTTTARGRSSSRASSTPSRSVAPRRRASALDEPSGSRSPARSTARSSPGRPIGCARARPRPLRGAAGAVHVDRDGEGGARPEARRAPRRPADRPVRFTQAATELIRSGATTFVEVGPGTCSPGS